MIKIVYNSLKNARDLINQTKVFQHLQQINQDRA